MPGTGFMPRKPADSWPASGSILRRGAVREHGPCGGIFPAHAELGPSTFRVQVGARAESPVVINEFMASNSRHHPRSPGDTEDWIELRNISDGAVDLSGWYLSDDPDKPRKWMFPAGTSIPAAGYLLVWADEDSSESPDSTPTSSCPGTVNKSCWWIPMRI